MTINEFKTKEAWATNEIEHLLKNIKYENQPQIIDTSYFALQLYKEYISCQEKVYDGKIIPNKLIDDLKCMIYGFPLTPITDDPEEWITVSDEENVEVSKRRNSLYRITDQDGTTIYIDCDRYEVFKMKTNENGSPRFEACDCDLAESIVGSLKHEKINLPYIIKKKEPIFIVHKILENESEILHIVSYRDAYDNSIKIDKFYKLEIGKDPEEIDKETFMKLTEKGVLI